MIKVGDYLYWQAPYSGEIGRTEIVRETKTQWILAHGNRVVKDTLMRVCALSRDAFYYDRINCYREATDELEYKFLTYGIFNKAMSIVSVVYNTKDKATSYKLTPEISKRIYIKALALEGELNKLKKKDTSNGNRYA